MPSDKHYGVYRGSVYNAKDPLKQRRLRLLVPQILGEAVTEWAWPMDAAGSHANIPDVGQGVWVMFEGGDPSFPIWTGTFGKYQGKGNQVKITELPAGNYPGTIRKEPGTNNKTEMNLLASIIALAEELDGLITAYNSHTNPPAGGTSTPYTRKYS
jgi:hypothetical protein